MGTTWTHTSTIRSAILIISEEHDINISGNEESNIRVSFSKPSRVDSPEWPAWNNAISIPAWDYNITMQFEAENGEAASKIAWRKIESIAARLSFVGVSPVSILSYGGVTNAPENPEEGKKYTNVIAASQQAFEFNGFLSEIDERETQYLVDLIIPDDLVSVGTERIERSMRWLQQSYLARTPADEFSCLMLAFEGLSNLIKEPEPRYWHCSKCGHDTKSCPNCNESTEWVGSGNIAMQEFVTRNLKWSKKKWKKIWRIRNKIFHGTQDLTRDNQPEISRHNEDLEVAVVNAIRFLLQLPKEAPPKVLRPRVPFGNAVLHIDWISPQTNKS